MLEQVAVCLFSPITHSPAPALGSIVFGTVYGQIYDHQAVGCLCNGVKCYRAAFAISSAALLLACTATLLLGLHVRARPLQP